MAGLGARVRGRRAATAALLVAVLAALLAACAPAPRPTFTPTPEPEREVLRGQALTGSRLVEGMAIYPRALELTSGPDAGTIVVGVVSFVGSNGVAKIFHSTDQGTSFSPVGEIRDDDARRELCCGTLYELPQAVGDLAAGTLVWSASAGQDARDRRMTLPLWVSSDAGRSWERYATIHTQPNTGGLWEPEFAVTQDGRLAVYAADESQQPTHSQTLVMSLSQDGRTWSPPVNIVALDDSGQRPGMPTVRRLPDGSYLLSYEICASPLGSCRQFWRSSPDGVDWGDPAEAGNPLTSAEATHFRHAPTLAWYPDGTPAGRLLTIGQMLFDEAGAEAAGSGGVFFVSQGDPAGPWEVLQAPVRVREPWDNWCPNYSPVLLPLPGSGRLLQLATAYGVEDNVCTTYVALGSLP